MLFNSFDFIIFFSIFFLLFYYFNGKLRNILLFVASSIFYMWFIPIYVLILYITIIIDYFSAIAIENSDTSLRKKRHLLVGIFNTCIVLFIFKYYNFFADNLNYIGIHSIQHWDVILPIGLSFHVFQSLSYIIEVYRGNIKAERNLLIYSNFVMMFPQLVAGPIERASNILPQLKNCNHNITYDDFSIGISRFIWGLFKKVVVADNASLYVDACFNNYTQHSGATLLAAIFIFAIQIYCDFSGYSDMAIGIARMLGFKFKENFLIPYFSKSVTDFWRRWHISLSTWLRDYLYFSFGGNRKGKFYTYRNLMFTMLIGGLWHGASWNFVIWGGLNGLFLAIEKAINISSVSPQNILVKIARISYVFIAICFTWVFFRAVSFSQAFGYLKTILFDFSILKFETLDANIFTTILIAILSLALVEYLVLRKQSFENIYRKKYGDAALTLASIFLLSIILLFGNSDGAQFIYFQF